MKGTKFSFMRDVLADKKLHLKQNEVIRLDIPGYQELSVKNLYEDAMLDPVLAKYLPTKEQLSNKLPEREFFFGILCTLRKQYMKDIIHAASSKRFKVGEDDPKKQGIAITDGWFELLNKHPYNSSKRHVVNLVEKPGTGIFLMKESSKLYRPQKEREKRKLTKRLGGPSTGSSDAMNLGGAQNKRQNLGGGQFSEVQAPKQGDTQMKSGGKA